MQSNATKILSLAIIFLMLVSCNKNEFDQLKPSEVSFKVSGNVVVLAGKDFVMNNVTVNLSDLQLEGHRIQGDPVSLSFALPQSINFLNQNINGNFDFPIGTYTSMVVTSEVHVDGSPSVIIEGIYYKANGDEIEVAIELDVEAEIIASVIDTDGSDVVFIEENLNKQFIFELDVESLFSDINQGLWMAATVTSNNGSETIAVDALHNQNIYDAISGKIVESFNVRFE